MLNLFKKKNTGQVSTFKITGMHCTSCALNINGMLEETEGVISADTNYAKSEVKVEYNTELIELEKIKKIVEDLGYNSS